MRGYIPATSEKEKIFQRRVEQAVYNARYKSAHTYLGFLSLREHQLAVASLNKLAHSGFVLDGGYQNAERLMLCVFDDILGSFPFSCFEIKVKENAKQLTHRDYLGALLGLGLQRECFGDIIVSGNTASVFLQSKISAVVQNELRQVGRCDVISIEEAEFDDNNGDAIIKEELTANVASLRLDAVLSAICGISRKSAVLYIEKGLVQVNHIAVASVSCTVFEEDVFSVRGLGKFKLSKIGGKSRKNRLFINYIKY